MPTAAHPTGHPLSPRRRAGLAVVVGILLALISATAPATAHRGGHHGHEQVVWHRLNPDQGNPAPEHERIACSPGRVWRCTYDKVSEPTLHADRTTGRFVGRVNSRWQCPEWFADHCDDVVTVVSGRTRLTLDDGTPFTLVEDLIITKHRGRQVMWVHIPEFGIAVPWYRTFSTAVRAAGFTSPYRFDGTNWPAWDGIGIP